MTKHFKPVARWRSHEMSLAKHNTQNSHLQTAMLCSDKGTIPYNLTDFRICFMIEYIVHFQMYFPNRP